MDLTWPHFTEWAFLGLLSGAAWMLLNFLDKISKTLVTMTEQNATLNKSLELIALRVATNEKEIDRHDHKLESYEERLARIEAKTLTRRG